MDLFAFIKSHVSIMNVVQEYVTLKRAGLYWKGRCPFHDEKTASFTISPHREIFYCFGCHKGGDAITFITELERYTPLQAAMHLAERYNIDIPQQFTTGKPQEAPGSTSTVQRHTALCTSAAQWCHQQLLKTANARDYVGQRGLNDHSIRDFMLGYFPEHLLNSLLEHMKKDGFIAKDLLEAHVLVEGKFGLYSPFAERIIFPIKDHLGRVCGFGGRTFAPNDQRPKYYNSQDHAFFSKGTVLFGLDRAKKIIQDKQAAFLVEGYMDCIAMAQAGYDNTVATLGTACTLEHFKTLARYAQRVYLVYDGDTAGQEAMVKVAQLVWAANIEPYVITLPPKEDPASLLQKQINVEYLIAQAQDIFSFVVQRLGSGYQSKPLQERIGLVQDVIATIALMNDPLKQNLLLHKAAATFNIPLQILVDHLHRKPSPYKALKDPGRSVEGQPFKPTSLEYALFAALVHDPKGLSIDDAELIQQVCREPIRLLISKFLIYNKRDGEFTFNNFLESLSPEEHGLAACLLIHGEESQTQAPKDLMASLWKKEWKRIANNVTERLKIAEEQQDTDAIGRISAEFSKLKESMREKGIL